MQISVAGRQVQMGTQLKTLVTERLGAVVREYFNNTMEAHIVFTAAGKGSRRNTQIQAGSGIDSQGEAS